MSTTLNFRTNLGRTNNWKYTLLSIIAIFAPLARIPIEIFTRRDFGRRYFNMFWSVILAIILFLLPFGKIITQRSAGAAFGQPRHQGDENAVGAWLMAYATWYIFLAIYLIRCWQHRQKLHRAAGEFDFNHYSKASGLIHPFFYQIKLGNRKTTARLVECTIEPGIFFIGGLLLFLIGQNLGFLFMVLSIMYSASYYLQYWSGDEYILDLIDQIIINRNLKKIFMNIEDTEIDGLRWRVMRPEDSEVRREVVDMIYGCDDIAVEAL